MAFFANLLGKLSVGRADPVDALRPLWLAVIKEARNPVWYRDRFAADTVEGRFDMIANITAIVLLRLEKDPELSAPFGLLTKLFSEDMEGQLRETGLGDPTLGKKMGKLMQSLAGRIGAYRTALTEGGASMIAAAERNSRLQDGASAEELAAGLVALSERLWEKSPDELFAGDIAA